MDTVSLDQKERKEERSYRRNKVSVVTVTRN